MSQLSVDRTAANKATFSLSGKKMAFDRYSAFPAAGTLNLVQKICPGSFFFSFGGNKQSNSSTSASST